MSRLPRKAFETNYYHVIVQGIGKEKIFEQGWMKAEYLNDLALYKNIHGIKVLTYVVMDNHCHMLLYAPDAASLGAYMRRVNTRYAQFYNHMCERVGYVFRDRYKSQAIFDDDYLINCMVYIHNNPVKVGIVQNPADYAHSGLQCYYGRVGLVDRDAAAEFFDVDAANVEAVMQEKSAQADVWCPEWLDVPEESRSAEEMIADVVARCGVAKELLRYDKERLKSRGAAGGCGREARTDRGSDRDVKGVLVGDVERVIFLILNNWGRGKIVKFLNNFAPSPIV